MLHFALLADLLLLSQRLRNRLGFTRIKHHLQPSKDAVLDRWNILFALGYQYQFSHQVEDAHKTQDRIWSEKIKVAVLLHASEGNLSIIKYIFARDITIQSFFDRLLDRC
jgi:hypothetical protein